MVSDITRITPRKKSASAFIEVHRFEFTGKRVFDFFFALAVTLFVLSWLLPLISLAICSTSPGPALFRQWRTGRHGRHFRVLKFRTMHHAPDSPFRQATREDGRVTRVGAYLRRTNLDEMPQFLNVLLGDMSVVGPRPHAVPHDAQYWDLQGYSERYSIRPGITGLAQVRGCRGETSELSRMRHRVKYDHYYIRNSSLWLDVRICWCTFKQMVRGNINAW